jgi:hypothetical protein
MAEFEDGHLIEGESHRFMAIDRQRNHFLCVIRPWRPDGRSQLLFASRLLEWRQINELYSKYNFNRPARVLIDAGFDTSAVYAFCAAHGFAAVMGEGRVSDYSHRRGRTVTRRFFSPPEPVNLGDIQQRWIKIGSRANHLFDTEALQVCRALMMGVLQQHARLTYPTKYRCHSGRSITLLVP